jgi:hypothetical protein
VKNAKLFTEAWPLVADHGVLGFGLGVSDDRLTGGAPNGELNENYKKGTSLSIGEILIIYTKHEFCVVRLNFASSDRNLRRPTEFCVVRPKFASSDRNLCFV